MGSSYYRSEVGIYGPGASMFVGSYYSHTNHGGLTTGLASANTNNRLVYLPIVIGRSCTLDRIGVDVTVNGNAGSVIRLGMYRDDGFGRPGALLFDAGTIAGDAATGTGPEITISQSVPAGLCWIASVAQSSATTRPTVRVFQSAWGFNLAPIVPGSASSRVGFYEDSVSGALPTNATITMANTVGIANAHAVYIRASA